ncbi:MAG: carboxymuconolactone decarboxylase family protein [Gammaproteobacteria bacterium]
MTTLQSIQDDLPAYAKDIKLNLSSLLNNSEHLTQQQFWGTMLASSMMTKNKRLLAAVSNSANENLSQEAFAAAKSATALMAMNNIYYRFTHLVSNEDYQKMSANLRMNAMAQPGIDKLDFELFSLAVSAINGCGKCMDAHEKVLTSKGISKETIQAATKIASILCGVAVVLETENL